MAQAYLMECGITPDYVQQSIGSLGDSGFVFDDHSPNAIASIIDRFINAWRSDLGVPFMPCLSDQALKVFHYWAQKNNVSVRFGSSQILAHLYQHPDCYKKRVRLSAERNATPRSMLMIDGLKPLPGQPYSAWWAECVVLMDMAIKKIGA